MENSNDVHACFRKMLSAWLKMIDPPPSWEGLLTALEHDSVKCGDVAESIRQRFGILKQPESEMMSEHSSSQAANPSGSRKYIYTIAYRVLRVPRAYKVASERLQRVNPLHYPLIIIILFTGVVSFN